MHIRLAVLLGLTTLLFACAEQPEGYAPSFSTYGAPEYATPGYPAYRYAPGYPGPGYYGSDVLIGGGGYWASENDRDRYWYHRRLHRERQLRDDNEAQARAQVRQQLQQQKAAVQAAQTQALQERAQAVQQLYQQRAQALAAQNQAIWQQRAAQQQAAARARGLVQ
jgi:hypothetical protein